MELEEFEELFGNIPINDFKKIKEYINKKFVSKNKFDEVNAELETYKKIAEKLAEELSKHIWLNDKDAIIKIYREEVEEDETHS